MTHERTARLQACLKDRYVDAPQVDPGMPVRDALLGLTERAACRVFKPDPVPEPWVDVMCAAAMAAPTKSDLQQRDIILLRSQKQRAALCTLVPDQEWIGHAPEIAVFCANNRRQRLLHDWHSVPFANDHLDAMFNAACDAAIALGAFSAAADAMGLGSCPISAIRNKAQAVSDLLGLPPHVFPFAGLAFGFPDAPPVISRRLPLRVTCHVDRYTEDGLQEVVADYGKSRAAAQPYDRQRLTGIFGQSDTYTWSDDKVRQYSQPERADFGAYLRACGFDLS